MFAKATRNFVSEIDPDGRLVPVVCLNNADNLLPLSLVLIRKRFWFWQQTRYQPSDFTLNDVLAGDQAIQPAVAENPFLKYAGTFGDNLNAKAETELIDGNIGFEGKMTSKLVSSFGLLKKDEVDVQKLLHDSKDKSLDLQHSLIKQTLRKKREVFGIVKERIFTTQECSVTEELEGEGTCSGLLGSLFHRKIKVSVKESGGYQSDSNVSLQIPANTVIAYSIIELDVKVTGQFELCLLPDALGGFEEDSTDSVKLITFCTVPRESPRSVLQAELDRVKSELQAMSGLPQDVRSSLFRDIRDIMKDKSALGFLEALLDQLCDGITPDLSTVEYPILRSTIQSVLDQMPNTNGAEDTPASASPNITAVHMLISALDEMPDDCLSLLGSCCSPRLLQALQALVDGLAGSRLSSLTDDALLPLAEEETYRQAENLFGSCDVTLLKEGTTVEINTGSQSDTRPLVLCIAVRGLAILGNRE
ncbi:gasdermin Eb [Denticeps clupeoides]|nr:gasdermin-E [Denticeps clupeoides]